MKKLLSYQLLALLALSLPLESRSSDRFFPELKDTQSKVLECKIVERTPFGFSFNDGTKLGEMLIIENTDRPDRPFELRYVFSESAGEDYDFYTHDYFNVTLGIVRASDLVIEEKEGKTTEELLADNEKRQFKQLLDYFAGVAGIEEPEDAYGYFLFSDNKGLTLNIVYLSEDGKVLGLGGAIYGTFRYACEQEAQEEKEAASSDEAA